MLTDDGGRWDSSVSWTFRGMGSLTKKVSSPSFHRAGSRAGGPGGPAVPAGSRALGLSGPAGGRAQREAGTGAGRWAGGQAGQRDGGPAGRRASGPAGGRASGRLGQREIGLSGPYGLVVSGADAPCRPMGATGLWAKGIGITIGAFVGHRGAEHVGSKARRHAWRGPKGHAPE